MNKTEAGDAHPLRFAAEWGYLALDPATNCTLDIRVDCAFA